MLLQMLEQSSLLLIDMSLKALLLAAIAWIALAALRVRAESAVHCTWALVLAGMLLLPLLSLFVPPVPLPAWLFPHRSESSEPLPVVTTTDASAESVLPLAARRDDGSLAHSPADLASANRVVPAASVPGSAHEHPDAAASQAPVATAQPWQGSGESRSRLLFLVAGLYCLVAGWLLVRLLVGMLLARKLLQRARLITIPGWQQRLPSRATVAASQEIHVPVTVGWRCPVILLPVDWQSWDASLLDMVLVHESEHIRRRDQWTSLAAQLNVVFYWFHPLAWMIRRRLAELAERICDDEVIRSTGQRHAYAENLVAMAARLLRVGRRWQAAGVAMARRAEVESRVEAIIDVDRPLAPRLSRLAAVGLLCLVVPLIALVAGLQPASGIAAHDSVAGQTPMERDASQYPASSTATAALANIVSTSSDDSVSDGNQGTSDDKKTSEKPDEAKNTNGQVPIVCVDRLGAPVVGAEIYVFQHQRGETSRYLHFGPFFSDQQGKALCDRAIFSSEEGTYDRWFYARAQGKLVGVTRSVKWKSGTIFNEDNRIVLQPSRSVEGQIIVPAGVDPTTIEVRVKVLHVISGDGDLDYDSFARHDQFPGLDTALPQLLTTRPDAEGRIQFQDVPVRGRLYVVTHGDGFAESQWRNDNNVFDEPIELRVVRESRVAGVVLDPQGQPLAGVEVIARMQPSRAKPTVSFLTSFQAITDDAGHFSIGGLPESLFMLQLNDQQQRFVFRPLEDLQAAAGEERQVTLQMESGVYITGQVTDMDGKPVEGASISAVAATNNGPGLSNASTDAAGRYRLHVPSGELHMYFNGLPAGFAYPDPQAVHSQNIQAGMAAIENLDFKLQRKADDTR